MANNSKMKKMVTFTAIISLLSFGYKLGMGIWTASIILIVASVSTFLVFIAKLAFIKAANKSRIEKKKSYLIISVVTFIYSLIFISFSVLKLFGIDTSNQKTYTGLYGAIFIGIIFVMFILSLYKLEGALENNDLIVIGLKEITFVSALTDLVIIEDFASRIILQYFDFPLMDKINSYFVVGISLLLLIIPFIMLARCFRYQP